MSEKIVIEFDDEEDKKKDNEKIVISFDDETGSESEGKVKQDESESEIIANSEISSYYYGNPSLDNFKQSELRFPEGIEHGFRRKFSVDTGDEFLNSILENNRFIILSSKNGSIYLIDRFSGQLKEKIYFEFQSFERTGLVHNNAAYIASVKKIFFMAAGSNSQNNSFSEIYQAKNENFIWSNLNRNADLLVFTELNSQTGAASLKNFDLQKNSVVSSFEFQTEKFLSDKICIAGNKAYVLFDSELLIYDYNKNSGETVKLNLPADENSFIFYLNNRLYIMASSNELYYLELPAENYKFKFSGIKNNYINSIAAFDDNIFAGTLDGWRFFKTSGMTVYNFENEYENKIECVSKNVLVISQRNKIIFINLSRFQEAEGFVMASNEGSESVEIVSGFISKREIFVLTKSGILEAFINDKVNIHL